MIRYHMMTIFLCLAYFTYSSPVPLMLQMALFCSFLWLSVIYYFFILYSQKIFLLWKMIINSILKWFISYGFIGD